MTLHSMTGFARAHGDFEGFRWYWEVKSVNNKGLDVRVKVPSFLDGLDLEAKKVVSGALTRGSVFLALNIEREDSDDTFVISESRLASLIEISKKYGSETVAPARMDGLLAIKGVVETQSYQPEENELKKLKAALTHNLKDAIAQLVEASASEGARMLDAMMDQVSEIENLTANAEKAAGDRTTAMQKRFKEQLEKLTGVEKPVSDERLAQEIAVLAVKSDVREEIDRLASHIADARDLLGEKAPVGRRLDFLCQEFNREANTLCSKASDPDLTRIGIALKTVIDQLREQVQNIE